MFTWSPECVALADLAVAFERDESYREALLYALYVLRRIPLAMKAYELRPLYEHELPSSLEWIVRQREVA
jgi:hypothetical protein